MPRKPAFFALVFACLLIGLHTPLVSAEEAPSLEDAPLSKKVLNEVKRVTARIERQVDQKAWKKIVARWDKTLALAEQYVDGKEYTKEDSKQYYQNITAISTEALEQRERNLSELAEQKRLLETLGAAPGEDQIQESEEISKKRAFYLAQVNQFESREAEIQLTLKRSDSLTEQLASLRREEVVERLKVVKPVPLAPATIAVAIPEFFHHTATITATTLTWVQALPGFLNERSYNYLVFTAALAIIVALIYLRRFLQTRYGRDPDQQNPSYSRRAVAALVEVFAQGGIPALIIIGVYFSIEYSKAYIEPSLSVPVEAGLQSALVFILLASFVRTVFSPRLPAWRLVGLAARNSYIVGSVLIVLVSVYALHAFFLRAFSNLQQSAELESLIAFTFLTVEAVGLLALTPQHWWRITTHTEEGEFTRRPSGTWNILRKIAAVAMLASIVAGSTGYIELSYYLLSNVANTVVIVALLFSLRAILHELVSGIVRAPFLREKLALRIITLQRIKFWVNAAVNPFLLLFGGFFIVRIWGVPQEDLFRWAQTVVTGFTVGSITISLIDIVSAIGLFVVGMLLTRALQRTLLKHVMPQVTVNVGMHHSISAGVGYLGLIVALMVGVSALGIDLSNIALIAGALSVGIGFGLQNIVSNFVSGIILIFEQPIKVDDWVIVNGQEGMVKRINFRATEIETFQKASVLIPNADLLANPVTNHTLKDKLGRIEVGVSVAYGTDTDLVEKLLLECASSQQHVVQHPEPVVLFQNFGADGLDFEVRCYTGDVLYKMIIASKIRFAVDKAFREAGIEIPYQQRVVHFANSPNENAAIPPPPEAT